MSQLTYDSRIGAYVGTTADGRRVVVDGDEWSEDVADAIRDEESERGPVSDERRVAIEMEMLDVSLWSTGEWDEPMDQGETSTEPPQPILPAPDDATTPESAQGIDRRYFAGFNSLLHRARLPVEIITCRRLDASDFDDEVVVFSDYDLIVNADVGDPDQPGWTGRCANAFVIFALHRTTGDRIELGGLYQPSTGTLSVWSEREQCSTFFALREKDVLALAQRVVLELAWRQLEASQS